MIHLRRLLPPCLPALGLMLACAPTPATPPTAAPAPAGSAAAPAASSAAAGAPAPPASAAASSAPTTACPPGQQIGSDGACAEGPPCVDGTVMMGACLCSDGKGVDATGHCVFQPCPRSTSGGTVFRSPKTGKCVECKAGSVPSGDGCCPAGQKCRD